MSKLIKTQLHKTPDISKLVKKFISSQTDYQHPPFTEKEQPSFSPYKRFPRKKGSLTDWRNLFNTHRKSQAKTCRETRQYKSDRKFDITQPSFYTGTNFKTMREGKKFTPQKTSPSFRQTNLQSAIMQNMYADEYIKERKIQTAKIKKYYEETHQEARPNSFNLSTRKRKQFVRTHGFSHDTDDQINQMSNQMDSNFKVQVKRSIHHSRILASSIWPQKYDTVRINPKYIQKNNELIYEGQKIKKNQIGLRFYGAQDRSIS